MYMYIYNVTSHFSTIAKMLEDKTVKKENNMNYRKTTYPR